MAETTQSKTVSQEPSEASDQTFEPSEDGTANEGADADSPSDAPSSDEPSQPDANPGADQSDAPSSDQTAPSSDPGTEANGDSVEPQADDPSSENAEEEPQAGEEVVSDDLIYKDQNFDPAVVGSVFALGKSFWINSMDPDDIVYDKADFDPDYVDMMGEEVYEPYTYKLVFQIIGDSEVCIGIKDTVQGVALRGSLGNESAFGRTVQQASNLYDEIDYYANQEAIPSTLIVPSQVTIDGQQFAVTTVADNAFSSSVTNMSNVVLSEGIINIGSNNSSNSALAGAFRGNVGLTSVSLPSTLTTIHDSSFYGCTGLESIVLPSGLQTLGTGTEQAQGVFNSCDALTSVTISGTADNPSQLANIGAEAFRGNTNLTTVNIGYGIKETGRNMFYQCTGLTNVTLPETLETLGDGTFRECTSLKKIELPQSLKTIGNHAFAENPSITGIGDDARDTRLNVLIPNSVETIGEGAFENCTGLMRVNFPDESQSNLATIGNAAFKGISRLTVVNLPSKLKTLGTATTATASNYSKYGVFAGSGVSTLVLPASLESLGAAALQGCKSLTTVRFSVGIDKLTTILPYTFYGCTSLTNIYNSVQMLESFDGRLPESVTTIDDFAFGECTALKKFVFHEGLTTLGTTVGTSATDGSQVFYKCSALTSIEISSTIENYGSNIFRQSGLTDITFAPGTKSTGDYMFNDCRNLESITLPASLGTNGGTIGKNMFNNCRSLMNVSFEEGYTVAGDYMFSGCTALTEVQLPPTLTDAADHLFNGCTGISSIQLPGSITSGSYMFAGCSSLKNLTFAEGYETIGDYMLAGLGGLTSIELPNTLKNLGAYAFKDCTGLTSITLPASLEVVGERIFDGCTNLNNVIFAEGFKVIGPYMFEGFSEMKGITLPSTLTELGAYAFKDCTGLTSITLPASLEIMGENVFQGCTNLADIKFAPGFKVIGDNMFEGFANLESITLPDTLETLGNYAFKDCVNLTSVTLPASLKNVGEHVFQGCESLETVEFGEGYSVVGAYMFTGLTGLKNIALPNTLTEIGAYAFQDCAFVDTVDLSNVQKIGEGAFKGCAKITEINLKSVVEIGADAFAGTNITHLTMPDTPIEGQTVASFADCTKLVYVNLGGIVNVDDSMFEGCEKLETVVMPNVTSLGNSVFKGCTSLSSIDLGNVVSIGNSVFENCSNLTDISLGSVTSIGDSAFAGCAKLPSIDLSSVSTIGNSTFANCLMLANVDLSGISSVGASAFSGCAALTTADLSSVTSIGESAFAGTGLTSVSIGAGLSDIGNRVFAACQDLTEVNLQEGIVVNSTHMFAGCPNLTTVNFVAAPQEPANVFTALASVFSASETTPLATLGANMFENCVKLANIDLTKVGVIGSQCFKGCTSLSSVNLANATSVAADAFQGSVLTSLTMPSTPGVIDFSTFTERDNLEYVDMGAITEIEAPDPEAGGMFASCTKLKTLIMDNVKDIPDNIFAGSPALETVSIKSAETIGMGAFAYCEKLSSIQLEKPANIGDLAFYACTSLQSIDLSKAVYVGSAAFYECRALGNVTIGDNATIAESAFFGLPVLTNVTIGSNVNINSMAFNQCPMLAEVTIGENSSIGECAFENCSVLENVVLGDDVAIGDKAFSACTGIANINLSGVKSIGSLAFNGCASIAEVDLTNATSVANDAFKGASITRLIMPMTPNVINFSAFDGHEKIVYVDLGAATTIGANQFTDCTQLETVVLRNVKTIRSSAFEGCASLRQIDLGGVESIGDDAFARSGLTSVTLPPTLGTNGGTVGSDVFAGCTSLATVTLGTAESPLASVTMNMFKGCTALTSIDLTHVGSIGSNAFQGCTSLADVTLGTVGDISAHAFADCASLANIDLSHVGTIGDSAFSGCTSLTEVNLDAVTNIRQNAFTGASIIRLTLPSNPAVIDFSAFESCTNLEYVDLGGATSVTDSMFTKCKNLTEVKLNNVTAIGDAAFSGCSKLASVDMAKVETIGDAAFSGCSLLANLDLSNVKGIGSTAFNGCAALGDIDLSAATSIGSNAFAGTSVTSVILGTGLANVGSSIFSGCPNLASVTLPEGMTATGMFMFSGCPSLTSVTVPSSLGVEGSVIGEGMFQGCANLVNVGLGTAEAPLETLGARMFDGCDSLATIDLSNVKSIGESAFANCQNIVEVDLSNVTHVATNAFSGANVRRLTLPQDTAVIDFAAFEGCDKLEYVDLGGATEIADGTFMACTNLEEVKLRNVKTIGVDAFKGCAVLANIDFANVDSVGNGAFEGCEGLGNIDLSQVKTIGQRAFAGCTGIIEANLANATSVASDAFSGASITRLIMPSAEGVIDFANFDNSQNLVYVDLGGLTSISDDMFVSCANLEDVVLRNVKSIGARAFEGCQKVKVIDLAGIESIGDRAFAGSGLISISLPETLGSNEGIVGESMFEGCANLATVEFSSNAAIPTNISNSMFKGCTSLAAIDLTDVQGIGDNAFDGCVALTEVTIPSTVQTIGDSIFANCTGMTQAKLGTAQAPLTSVAPNMFNGCTNLVTADLSNIEVIGAGAFNDCAKLEDVDLTNATTIAEGAFAGTRIKRLTLPRVLETLDAETFKDCDYLLYVNLGGVRTIGDRAFVGCEKLSTVVFNNVQTVGTGAFDGCAKLATVRNSATVQTIGDNAFRGCAQLAGVDLSSASTIGSNAFSGCSSIASISLSGDLATVSDGTFSGCTSLEDVTAPAATSVGTSAFEGCSALVTVEAPVLANVGDSAFAGCSKLFEISQESIETIGNNAFKGCAALTTIELPNAKSLGDSAFAETKINSVKLGVLPEHIGNAVFADCTSLHTVGLPEGVTVTSSDLFRGCTNLMAVEFTPTGAETEALATLGANMFNGCSKLANIDLSKVKSAGDGALEGCIAIKDADLSNFEALNTAAFVNTAFENLILPSLGLSVLDASHMSNFATVKVLDCGGVSSINAGALSALSGLEQVTLNSVTSIAENVFTNLASLTTVNAGALETVGDRSFKNCSALSTINLEGVHTIGEEAFLGCSALALANISSATSIGNSAFASSGLTSATIDAVLQTAGNGIFSNCANLASITVGSGAVLAGDSMFVGCSALTDINLADGVTLSGNSLFAGCSAITNLTIPSNATISGNDAFKGCSNLVNIELQRGASVTGASAFEGCLTLAALDLADGISLSGINMFRGCAALTDVTIPSSITEIKDGMFQDCSNLANVQIPSVTKISTDAFKECSNLEVVIGDSLTEIGNGAFENCVNLSKLNSGNVTSNIENVTILGDAAFKNTTSLKEVNLTKAKTIGESTFEGSGIQHVVLGNALEQAGDAVFNGCLNLVDIKLKEGATISSNRMFKGCSNLGSITFEPGVKVHGDEVFSDCEALTSVYAGTGNVEIIGDYVFSGCTALNRAELPKTIVKGEGTFKDCISLTRVSFFPADNTTYTLADRMFQNCTSLNNVELAMVTEIGVGTFEGCSSLMNLNLQKARSIGDYAFKDCPMIKDVSAEVLETLGTGVFSGTSLQNLTLSSQFKNIAPNMLEGVSGSLKNVDLGGTTNIEDGTFQGFTALTDVTMSSAETVGANAFSGCTNLANANMASIKTMGDGAFADCTSIEDADLSSLTAINAAAFTNTFIKNLKLPLEGIESLDSSMLNAFTHVVSVDVGGAKSLNNAAFANCPDLASVKLNNVETINKGVFNGCANLTNINFGNVSTVGPEAFKGCASLVTLEDFSGVTSIGDKAFMGCTALSDLTLPNTISSVGANAFDGCTGIVNLVFEEGSTATGSRMFNGCEGITRVELPGTLSNPATNMFQDCTNLSEVVLGTEDLPLTTISKQMFDGCINLATIDLSKVTSIGEYAFMNCKALTNANLLSVTEIGQGALSGTKVINLELSQDLKALPRTALEGCETLQTIDFGGVEAIEDSAFSNYISLKSINMPSASTIGAKAFEGCTNLTDVTFADGCAIGDSAFNRCRRITTVDLSKISSIGASAFEECDKLVGADLTSVKSIGKDAFSGCDVFQQVNLPVAESIGDSAFSRTALSSVALPATLGTNGGTVGANIFKECQQLTSAQIPDELTSISDGMFWGCPLLTTVKLDNIQSIGSNAFNGCPVSDVNLAKVESIGDSAFAGTSITSANLSSIQSIGAGVFEGCTDLATADLSSITSPGFLLGANIFKGCAKLEKLVLPVALTEIGDSAFQGASQLGVIEFKGQSDTTATSIPSNGFAEAGATNLQKLVFFGTRLVPSDYSESVEGSELFGGQSTKTYVTLYFYDTIDGLSADEEAVTYDNAAGYLCLPYDVKLSHVVYNIEIDDVYASKGYYNDPDNACILSYDMDSVFISASGEPVSTQRQKSTDSFRCYFFNCDHLVPEITLAQGPIKYTGSELEPLEKVAIGGRELTEDQYKVTYENNVDAGEAKVTVALLVSGVPYGTAEKTFTIEPADMESVHIDEIEDQSYLADPITPEPVVTLGDKTLEKDVDYTLEYTDNINVGTATITLKGTGNFTGDATTTFEIVQGVISNGSVAKPDAVVYKGSAHEPDLTVKMFEGTQYEKTLTQNVDYDVEYTNNVNAGTASVLITGKGGYMGELSTTFSILPKDVSDVEFSGISDQTYTGSEIEPTFELQDEERGEALEKGTDFTVRYSNNVITSPNIGSRAPTLAITGKGNYTGKISVKFAIVPRDVEDAIIEGISDVIYNGNPFTPEPVVKLDMHAAPGGDPELIEPLEADAEETDTLVKSRDYTVEYADNTNAGTASVIVKGTGNFTGQATATFQIAPKSLDDATITNIEQQIYAGDFIEPEFAVANGIGTLERDKDYTVEYANNKDVGTATVTITGTGNYQDTRTIDFIIVARAIEPAVITGYEDVVYNGSAFTPELTVSFMQDEQVEKTLEKDRDFTVEYANNIDSGQASATIKGIGGYVGQQTINFQIEPKDILDESINYTLTNSYVYTGQEINPEGNITDKERNGAVLVRGSDYNVSYENNVNAASPESESAPAVVIEGVGNYAGKKSIPFTIEPRNIVDAQIGGIENVVYNRSPFEPAPIVTLAVGQDANRQLIAGTEYEVEYTNNTNAGEAMAVIKGIGNFAGNAFKTFQITPKSINDVSVTNVDDQIYTGDEMLPEVSVADGEDALVKDSEYTISYENNTAVGKAVVTVTGKGNYTDSRTLEFNINSRSIADAEIAGASDVVYTGNEFTPEVTVTLGNKKLVKDADYTVAYSDNTNAGAATVTISGMGGYSGQASTNFQILPKSINDVNVAEVSGGTYTGSVIEPAIAVSDPDRNCSLVGDTDYSIEFANNINAATITAQAPPQVKITGKGNYTGTRTVAFTIDPMSIDGATVSGIENSTYDGTAQEPEPVVVMGEGGDSPTTLAKDTDYVVEYADNTNVGEASVIVRGIGNYAGSVTSHFQIGKKDISSANIASIPNQTYTGEQVKPVLEVSDGDTQLVEGSDFTTAFSDNISVGEAGATITGEGNYTGTQTAKFQIVCQSISEAKLLGVSDATYNGSPHTPEPVVVLGGKVLEKGVDYTVSHSNNVNAGKASVVVTGINGYDGSASANFNISRKNIADGDVLVDGIDAAVYTGTAIEPNVAITDNTRKATLEKGADFSVVYDNNVKAATITDSKAPTAVISGEGNYTGSRSVTFTIDPRGIDDAVVSGLESVVYTGSEFTPEPVVSIDDAALEAGTDFTVGYDNNVNAGTAIVKITGRGNYSGTKDATFEIGRKSIGDMAVSKIADQTFTGAAIEPEVAVLDGKKELVQDVDFNVSYASNLNVEDVPSITIQGIGNYDGNLSATFNIVAKDIAGDSINVNIAEGNIYTGGGLAPEVTVTDSAGEGDVTLRQDVDYKLSYVNNTNAGNAESFNPPAVSITGIGNYKGVNKCAFTIEPKSVDGLTIDQIADQVYSAGEEITPKLTVKDGATTLKLDRDFELEYSNNTDAGTANVTLNGLGNYVGTKSTTFEIVQKNIGMAVMAAFDPQTYNGKPIEPEIMLIDGNRVLEKGTDFNIEFNENTNAGTASVTITGTGNYTSSKTVRFLISAKSLSGVEIGEIPAEIYDGNAHTPHPEVTLDGTTLEEGTDYAVSYSNNVNFGTASITITGTGNYNGMVSSTFDIQRRTIEDAIVAEIPNEIYKQSTDHTSIAHEPTPFINIGERRLVKDLEYELSYENNAEAGVATVKATGIGNYTGEITANFEIEKRDISDAFISPLPNQTLVVGGNTPSPTVNVEGVMITQDVDFSVEYENNDDVGEATLIVKGIGNYTGTKTTTFNIVAHPFDYSTIITVDDQVYDGTYLEPAPKVMIGTKVLEPGTEYVTEYENNKNAGEATLTITGIGNYSGSKSKIFNINPRPLTEEGISLEIANQIYSEGSQKATQVYSGGSQVTPEVDLTDRGSGLLANTDFKVSYSNNINVGEATVTVMGMNNYQGELQAQFDIVPKPMSDDEITLQINENSIYSGVAKTPAFTVKYGDIVLSENTDYTFEYANNTNAATITSDLPPTLIVKGKGNYGGERRSMFTIYQKSLAGATIEGLVDAEFTGEPIDQNVTVKLEGKTLVEGKDYELSYNNTNVNAGVATVTVSGINNYKDKAYGNFSITQKTLSGAVIAEIPDQTYTGSAITPDMTITVGGVALVKDKDYIVRFSGNKDAGTASFSVTGINNYTGSLNRGSFKIVPKPISQCQGSAPSQIYTGSEIRSELTLKNGNISLELGKDYAIERYANNKNVGTASIFVKGNNNYTGTCEIHFAITAKNIASISVSTPSAQQYSGEALKPKPVVKNGGITLTEGTDYSLSWSNNINAGSGASVTVTGRGNYNGTKNVPFVINPADISSAVVSPVAAMVYTGAAQSPAVVVTDNGKTLVQGSNFDVSYNNNVNAGNGSIVITGKGNYTGTITSSFVIGKGNDAISGGTKSKSFKVKNLKKKKATFKIGAKAATTLKYKAKKYVKVGKITAAKAKKAVKIASNGTVTVNKKTAKGTYKVQVEITAAGNANLNGAKTTLTLQIKVK